MKTIKKYLTKENKALLVYWLTTMMLCSMVSIFIISIVSNSSVSVSASSSINRNVVIMEHQIADTVITKSIFEAEEIEIIEVEPFTSTYGATIAVTPMPEPEEVEPQYIEINKIGVEEAIKEERERKEALMEIVTLSLTDHDTYEEAFIEASSNYHTEEIPNGLIRKTNKNMIMNLSNSELEVLLRIVESEATGEDIYGKMLIANVVLNRLHNSHFPNTIKDVVFQRTGKTYQFSPILDGRYWSVTITDSTREAVERVLSGEDYSQGALYFFARKYTSVKNASWFDRELDRLFKHGCHEFFTER